MKISIEMESEDWLELCSLHHQVMEIITKNMAQDPLAYSSAARLTNQVLDQVIAKMPYGELDEIKKRQQSEKDY
jgi:hypothetical protein